MQSILNELTSLLRSCSWSLSRSIPTKSRNRIVRRIASQQYGEHKCWRPCTTTATESAGTRSSYLEHPSAQDESQGTRREHHQRSADGLKVNWRYAESAHRPRVRDGVTSKRAILRPKTFQIRRGVVWAARVVSNDESEFVS